MTTDHHIAKKPDANMDALRAFILRIVLEALRAHHEERTALDDEVDRLNRILIEHYGSEKGV